MIIHHYHQAICAMFTKMPNAGPPRESFLSQFFCPTVNCTWKVLCNKLSTLLAICQTLSCMVNFFRVEEASIDYVSQIFLCQPLIALNSTCSNFCNKCLGTFSTGTTAVIDMELQATVASFLSRGRPALYTKWFILNWAILNWTTIEGITYRMRAINIARGSPFGWRTDIGPICVQDFYHVEEQHDINCWQ